MAKKKRLVRLRKKERNDSTYLDWPILFLEIFLEIGIQLLILPFRLLAGLLRSIVD